MKISFTTKEPPKINSSFNRAYWKNYDFGGKTTYNLREQYARLTLRLFPVMFKTLDCSGIPVLIVVYNRIHSRNTISTIIFKEKQRISSNFSINIGQVKTLVIKGSYKEI